METWDLNNKEHLMEIAETYSHTVVTMMKEELERGEVLPQSARRQIIAQRFGLPEEALLKAVAEGTELNWQRHTADWTDEDWAEYNERRRAFMPLIAEAVAEADARKREVDELNRLFDL